MLSILNTFGNAVVGDTQREEVVGYYQELKGNIDFTHMTESTNVSRRFSRPLQENVKLLKDVRSDLSHLKSLALKARKIQPLTDAIMSESDIYKTIASLRTVERSTVAELTKIAEKTLQYEQKLKDNISGVGTGNYGTSTAFQAYLDSGMTAGGGYGSSVQGKGVKTVDASTDTSDVKYEVPVNTTPTEGGEKPVEAPKTPSQAVNIGSVPAEEAGLFNDNITNEPTATIGEPQETTGKQVGFIDYGLAMSNLSRKNKGGERVMCLNNATSEYWVAYKYEDGTFEHEHSSLPLVSTLSGATWNLESRKAKDKIGGTYPLEVVGETPSGIRNQWDEMKAKKERMNKK